MYVYVKFLTREIRDSIDFETTMFQIGAWNGRLPRYDYVLFHRSYLRKILRLIQKNINGYVDGTKSFDVFEEEIIVDSSETIDAIMLAEKPRDACRIKPVEYLRSVADALELELSKEVPKCM